MSRSESLRRNNPPQTKLCYVAGTTDAVNRLIFPLRFGQLQLPDDPMPLSFRFKPFIPTTCCSGEGGVLVIAYNTKEASSFSHIFSGAYDYELSGLSLIVAAFVSTEDPTKDEKANIEDGQKFAEALGAAFFKIKHISLPLQADSAMVKIYKLIAELAQPVPTIHFLDPVETRPESTHESPQVTNLSLGPR